MSRADDPAIPLRAKPVSLRLLHEEVDARSGAIARAHPDWPCRRGCDHCCRSLPRAPELTVAEWEHLWVAFQQLDALTRSQVRKRLKELRAHVEQGVTPVTCPLLDSDPGVCLVYSHRPAACRMYGFYISRGEGQYCARVHERVQAGLTEDVVWGNHDAVENALRCAFGPTVSMPEWFDLHTED